MTTCNYHRCLQGICNVCCTDGSHARTRCSRLTKAKPLSSLYCTQHYKMIFEHQLVLARQCEEDCEPGKNYPVMKRALLVILLSLLLPVVAFWMSPVCMSPVVGLTVDNSPHARCCWTYMGYQREMRQRVSQDLDALQVAQLNATAEWDAIFQSELGQACLIGDIEPCTSEDINDWWDGWKTDAESQGTWQRTLASSYVDFHKMLLEQQWGFQAGSRNAGRYLEAIAVLKYRLGGLQGTLGEMIADGAIRRLQSAHEKKRVSHEKLERNVAILTSWLNEEVEGKMGGVGYNSFYRDMCNYLQDTVLLYAYKLWLYLRTAAHTSAAVITLATTTLAVISYRNPGFVRHLPEMIHAARILSEYRERKSVV
jgi:hypothetical protein